MNCWHSIIKYFELQEEIKDKMKVRSNSPEFVAKTQKKTCREEYKKEKLK